MFWIDYCTVGKSACCCSVISSAFCSSTRDGGNIHTATIPIADIIDTTTYSTDAPRSIPLLMAMPNVKRSAICIASKESTLIKYSD